jgi:hypothetical protein
MQYSKHLRIVVGALLSGGLLITSGCGDVDQSGSEAEAFDNTGTETEALWGQRWYRPPRTETGGSSTVGGASSGGSTSGGTTNSSGSASSSCSICATTQSCCESVDAGALCTFSADTCTSLDPLRQGYYAKNCLMVLRTIISAQTMNQRTAPSACYLPQ